MRILAIDYGRKKIGLAISNDKVAEPKSVIRYKYVKEVLAKISEVIENEKIERVVVGISEGKMEMESRSFARALREIIKVPVVTYDETLSTHDAQNLSIKAGLKRKKRKNLEDAYAAAIMLQNYLDSNAQN